MIVGLARVSDGKESVDWRSPTLLELTYLELVLSGLSLRRRVQEIDCENLLRVY